jgi:phytoene desaturase
MAGSGTRRAVIIGSGFGGLAAAIRLLSDGWQVTVLEARGTIGGRASRIRDGGYTFDTGPSLITMPWLFDEVYAAAGTRMADHVTLRQLEPGYRIFWTGEQRHFDFGSNQDRLREEMRKFSADDAAQLDAFLAASGAIHREGILVSGRKNFLNLGDFVKLLPTMARLDAIRFLEGWVAKYFREPHVQQAFGFHSLFIGGDPARVPAIYSALAYLQVADGIWYTEGGVYSLIESFGNIIRTMGGEIITGAKVNQILHRQGRAVGVRVSDGTVHDADAIIYNGDVRARDALLPDVPDLLPWRLRPLRTTMSAHMLYLGTTRRFEKLLHHTLVVGDDYHGFIRDVTRERRIPRSNAVYIHAPSRTEPGMAPVGGDSIAILLPVPNLASGDDWRELAPRLRDRTLEWLEGWGLPGLRDSIAVEHSWTPLTFRDELLAPDGNAFAIEPSLQQSAYFRQPNRDRALAGLYYVGGGTHPGAGMPGALLTAQVTQDLMRDDYRGPHAPRSTRATGSTGNLVRP